MSGWASRSIHWLGIAILAFMATNACAQGNRAKVITWNSPETSEIYVGILGEIAKPGVYRLDSRSLSLQNVIHRAGGLTDEASGTIRIVRQDRIVESLYFSPNSSNPLLAGDLLVVESARAQAAISRMYDAEPEDRAKYAEAAEAAMKSRDPAGVQVAFVNVLDRPVIVKVKHENALVEKVVQMLDQPLQLVQDVRVIGPDRVLTQTATPVNHRTILTNGSVLVFPKHSINRRTLPSLPIPYESEIATGAIPSLIGGASGHSAELRNVGQLPVMSGVPYAATGFPSSPALQESPSIPLPSAGATFPAASPAGPVEPGPAAMTNERADTPNPAAEMPLVSTPPRIATIPFSGQPRLTTSASQFTASLEPERPQPAAVEPPQAKPQARVQMELDDGDGLEDDDPQQASASSSSGGSLALMMGIITSLGLLTGAALMTRRYLQRKYLSPHHLNEHEQQDEMREFAFELEPEAETVAESILEEPPVVQVASELVAALLESPEPPSDAAAPSALDIAVPMPTPMATNIAAPSIAAAAQANWLDLLLLNELPVREEAPEFPAEIALQGRILAPPVYRVDRAAAPQGPHFATRTDRSRQEAPVIAASEEKTQEFQLPVESPQEPVFDAFDAPHGSRPGRPHFMRHAAPQRDKAMTTPLSRNSMRSTTSREEKPSSTPVADALRHLQGESL